MGKGEVNYKWVKNRMKKNANAVTLNLADSSDSDSIEVMALLTFDFLFSPGRKCSYDL